MTRSLRSTLSAVLLAGLLPVSHALSAGAAPSVVSVSAGELEQVLAEHEGSVVLVNFWATWCPPCVREIAALRSVEDQLAAAGFVFVPLSMDDPGSGADGTLQAFIDRWFPGFTTYLRRETDLYMAASHLDPEWNEILPTTYLIDRDGIVVRRIQGVVTEDEILRAVAPMLENR